MTDFSVLFKISGAENINWNSFTTEKSRIHQTWWIFRLKVVGFKIFFNLRHFYEKILKPTVSVSKLLTLFDLQWPQSANKSKFHLKTLFQNIKMATSGITSGFSFHNIRWYKHWWHHLHDKLLPSKKRFDWMFQLDPRLLLVGIEIL